MKALKHCNFDTEGFSIEHFDVNGNNEIDYSEFLAATTNSKQYTEKARLEDTFKSFDINSDTKIDQNEAIKGLQHYDMSITEEKVKEMIARVDKN